MVSDELLGRVVRSKRGRDQGKIFVIVKVINDQFVIIADGDLRKIENPKVKNLRHLQLVNLYAEDVLQSLTKGEIPPNHMIKKNIKKIQDPQSAGKEV